MDSEAIGIFLRLSQFYVLKTTKFSNVVLTILDIISKAKLLLSATNTIL